MFFFGHVSVGMTGRDRGFTRFVLCLGHPPPADTKEDSKEQPDGVKDEDSSKTGSDAFTTSLGVLRQDVSFVSSAPLVRF